MRRAVFFAACVGAGAAGAAVGAVAALARFAWESGGGIREGLAEFGREPLVDLTVYEAHARPVVEIGHREGLAWISTESHPN